MQVTLVRPTQERRVSFNNSTDSEPINVDGFSAGMLLCLPDNFAGATVTFKARCSATDDFVPLHSGGAAISSTVSAGALNNLDDAKLFGIADLIIVSDAVETCEGSLYVSA